jgi:hypothetical protein
MHVALFLQIARCRRAGRTLGKFALGEDRARHIAIDGKALKGSRRLDTKALHVLSAFAAELGTVIGDLIVEPDQNEIMAAMVLLKGLPLDGAIISGDAIFCQREICRHLRDGNGHYLFVVKDNQPQLKADIAESFGDFSPSASAMATGAPTPDVATADKTAGIEADQIIRLAAPRSRARYPERLRRVSYRDRQIELFFKWIKQNLSIKSFFGTSVNAVRTQIWIAVSVYVLIAILKKRLKLDASLSEIMQTLSVTLFEDMPLDQLLANARTTDKKCEDANQLDLKVD